MITPLLQLLTYKIVEALQEEVLTLVKQELGGVQANHELIANNLSKRLGVSMESVVEKLKEVLADGEITKEETQELQKLLMQLEV